MQTAVTKRGQTVIPAAIRKRYHIEEGDSLVWHWIERHLSGPSSFYLYPLYR